MQDEIVIMWSKESLTQALLILGGISAHGVDGRTISKKVNLRTGITGSFCKAFSSSVYGS